ncbi:DUF3102 domain-containing protein [Agrobacterium pusense]|uniref:DUF3102 domain-containing protein n=1 Tax=Agrobacterium pusense TaxID=648995 RepID=A0A6H0ZJQ2_9HYPH|nr:DUF3102 domain-containing protein [Agrobacterium pusense]QIX20224.1 DUF3102 domain-containing protein [Agrobacterium pusense]
MNAAFIETGRDLAVQKEALGHGNFLKWIEAEFGLGERSAQNLMSMAQYVDANPQHAAVLKLVHHAAPNSTSAILRWLMVAGQVRSRNLTPGPLPFDGMKIIPAASRAD